MFRFGSVFSLVIAAGRCDPGAWLFTAVEVGRDGLEGVSLDQFAQSQLVKSQFT